MKEFSIIFQDKIIRYSLVLSGIFIVVQFIIVVFFYAKIPPVIPFYNILPWGSERLANSYMLFTFPLGMIACLLFNTYLSMRIYKKHTLIARMLNLNVFLIAFLGCLALIQILLLVF